VGGILNGGKRIYFSAEMAMKRKRPVGSGVTKPVKKKRASAPKNVAFMPRPFGNALAVTERKYVTLTKGATALVASASDWTGTEFDPSADSLFAPVQGDDFNQRDGRKVQVLAIKIKGFLRVPGVSDVTAGQSGTHCRIIVYQDKQTNGAQAQGEDVMEGVASNAVNSFQNPANFGRFNVLKDKTYSLHPVVSTYDGTNIEVFGRTVPFKYMIKFKKPVIVHYNATTTATITAIVDNSFHLIANCNVITVAPTIQYVVRTTFIDM